MEEHLFSGFLSAVTLFISEFVDRKLEIMEIEYLRLIFRELNDFLFVAFVDEYESIAHVKEILEKISENFFQIYGGILEKWNSDLRVFQGFSKYIESILTEEDIHRMVLIENLGNLLDLKEESVIEGISIFTSRAELMVSNKLDEKTIQFLIKLIENNQKIDFKFDQIVVNWDNQFLIIENISDSLIGAILTKSNLSIYESKAVCKIFLKELRTRVDLIKNM